MRRALIISNLATISLLVVWTSSQALPWKLAATPVLWGLVAWLADECWELSGELWKEVRRWQKR